MSPNLVRLAHYFRNRPTVAVLAAAGLALLAVAARSSLPGPLGEELPFVSIYPAVVLSALFGGALAGLAATFVGASAIWYFFLSQTEAPAGAGTGALLSLLVYLGGAILVVWVASQLVRVVRTGEQTKAQLTAAVRSTGSGTWSYDIRSGVLELDSALSAIYGFQTDDPPRTPHSFLALLHPEDRDRVSASLREAVANGRAAENEFRLCNGKWLHDRAEPVLDGFGQVAAIVGSSRDVTGQKDIEWRLRARTEELERVLASLETRVSQEVTAREAAQTALARAQKMEAIGQLTGGVAHDFNNLLQALAGCLQMIQRRVPDPAIRSFVEAGQQAVERGGRLTQQLMAFSRRQALRPEATDVRDQVLGMSELLSRALRADIDVTMQLQADLWPIEVDPTQFEVALLNLAVNARDAMPEGGQLSFECANVALRSAEAPEGAAGDYVTVTVRDTGEGIPTEVIERVFDPFFTTKPVGKGSGLGLSQVYGFARQSGGAVRIASRVGEGTAVTLVLPRARRQPAAGPAPTPRSQTSAKGGSILVVEDDPIVGAMVTTMLKDFGFNVERAHSADEASERLDDGLDVDLVFTDVIMPGRMSGLDLARKLRDDRPDLPVLLTTGYSESMDAPRGVRLLTKPYQIGQLLAAVEEEIRSPEAAGADPEG